MMESPIPILKLRATGSIGYMLTGLVFGVGMVWVGADMTSVWLREQEGPLWIGVYAPLAFFGAVGLLLLFVGAVHAWYRFARPVMAIADSRGIESRYLVWGGRLDWSEVTHVSFMGQFIRVHGATPRGKRTLHFPDAMLGDQGTKDLLAAISAHAPHVFK
jgi:hypothetical protein